VLALVKDSAFTGVTSGNYYVEARIKPQTNGTTGNKQLYLIARYRTRPTGTPPGSTCRARPPARRSRSPR